MLPGKVSDRFPVFIARFLWEFSLCNFAQLVNTIQTSVLCCCNLMLILTCKKKKKKLSCLKVNKAAGPFDPNTRIIKIFAKYFARPLTHIFNESFACRLFPDIWKVSKVCGIPKSKPCCSVDLLRPIALTSTLSKIQESYATEWIYEDVKDEISEFQFGGLPGTSAVQALIYLMH